MAENEAAEQVLRIATARIDHRAAPGDRVLDVTTMSADEDVGKLMAPGWNAVRAFKDGRIDWETYTERYRDLLRERYARYAQAFHDLIREAIDEDKRLVLVCYCNVGPGCDECHRFLMADILEKIAEQEGYLTSREGDLSRDRAPQPSPQLPLGL